MNKERISILDDIAKRASKEVGVSLYDVEEKKTNHGLVAIIYITKLGGVTVDECTSVSRIIGAELELLDIYKGKYTIEVSSPGLERELKYKKHYASAINNRVKIKYQEDEQRLVVEGILKEVSPQAIKIETNDNEIVIPFTSIKKARTLFDFSDTKEKK